MVRGVIALWNQYESKNERGADIAHSQKLTAHEGETFVALRVVVIWQRAIIRLKPITRVESRWIAVDVSAIQFRSSRTTMMIAENFDFVRDQFSNPAWHVRFARWR